MESFWQGMPVKEVFREKKDLIVRGETIGFPCAEEFILENEPSNYSKDLKLKSKSVNPQFLKERVLDKYSLLGIKFNPEMKRNEIVQIALPNGWCWDET